MSKGFINEVNLQVLVKFSISEQQTVYLYKYTFGDFGYQMMPISYTISCINGTYTYQNSRETVAVSLFD